ncbi:MAG TPA: DUF4388 domain-containing protein, partial [Polyangia bacterium]
MAKSSPSRLYAGKSAVPTAARAVLHGDLTKVGLATVLTILELERRTGVVLVKHARQTVRVEVSQGQVVRARQGGRAPARGSANGSDRGAATGAEGAEAIYTALSWPSGQCERYSVAVDPRDE